jgi:hypothetical protein
MVSKADKPVSLSAVSVVSKSDQGSLVVIPIPICPVLEALTLIRIVKAADRDPLQRRATETCTISVAQKTPVWRIQRLIQIPR